MLEKDRAENGLIKDCKLLQVKKELIDACQDHGVKEGKEYAILTNELSKVWAGMTTREYSERTLSIKVIQKIL